MSALAEEEVQPPPPDAAEGGESELVAAEATTADVAEGDGDSAPIEPEVVEPGPEIFDGVLRDLGPDLPGSLVKSGASTLILTGDHEHTGLTMVSGGTLQLGDGGETGSVRGPLSIHGTLVVQRAKELEYASAVAGAGRLRQTGSGRLTLSGKSSARGTLEVGGGGVVLSGAWAGAFEVCAQSEFRLHAGHIGADGAVSTIAAEALVEGTGMIRGGVINYGELVVEGSWSILTVRGGAVTNAPGAVMRASQGATLNLSGASLFVNQGIIDRISGTIMLPPAFRNLGVILDSSAVRIKSAARQGDTVFLSIDGHTGHTYLLQRGRSLAPESFVSLGKPQPGRTGREIRFVDPAADEDEAYYRVVVDPRRADGHIRKERKTEPAKTEVGKSEAAAGVPAALGPSAESAAPSAEAAERSVEAATPSAESAAPNAESAAPNAESAAPNAESAGPNAESAAPTVEAAAPNAKAGQGVEFAAPSAEAAAPIEEASAPKVEAAEPSAESAAPRVEAAEPNAEAAAPTTPVSPPAADVSSPTSAISALAVAVSSAASRNSEHAAAPLADVPVEPAETDDEVLLTPVEALRKAVAEWERRTGNELH